MDRADNFLDGNNDGDLLGTYVTVLGDYDGDGVNDLAIGAMGASSNTGAVYVLGGDDALSGDLSDVMATYTGSASGYFGRGIGTEIDLNADGYDELVVAYASGSNNYVALQYGEASPNSASVSSMDIRWSTDGQEVQFYRNAPVGGDFDGDGYDDLILCDGEAEARPTTGRCGRCGAAARRTPRAPRTTSAGAPRRSPAATRTATTWVGPARSAKTGTAMAMTSCGSTRAASRCTSSPAVRPVATCWTSRMTPRSPTRGTRRSTPR
jgi:hypothetical protein